MAKRRSKGQGTILVRDDKRVVARLNIGQKDDGKPIRIEKYFTGKQAKAEAQIWLNEQIVLYGKGVNLNPEPSRPEQLRFLFKGPLLRSFAPSLLPNFHPSAPPRHRSVNYFCGRCKIFPELAYTRVDAHSILTLRAPHMTLCAFIHPTRRHYG